MTHAGTKSQLRQSIQLNLENLHIIAGINTSIFSLPYLKYKMLVEHGWIQNL